MSGRGRPFTPEEDELIKRYFRRRGRGSKWLMQKLGRRRSSVHARAHKLGVVPRNRRWSAEDDEYLVRNYGLLTDEGLARKLDRTVMAIRVRMNHKRIVRTYNFLCATDVGRIFGVHQKVVTSWILLGYLESRKRRVVRKARQRLWCIDPYEVERFTRNYPHVYDIRRIDKEGYPRIYELAKNAGADRGVPQLYREWTADEDTFVLNHHHRLPLSELARQLRRSKCAISQRIFVLRSRGHHLPYKRPWNKRKQTVGQQAA